MQKIEPYILSDFPEEFAAMIEMKTYRSFSLKTIESDAQGAVLSRVEQYLK